MNIQVYIFGNCYFGVGGIFNVPAKQPRKVAWPPAGPERERRYSARSQQPRIDAVSHQARSLILISACGMIHRATAEGFSRSAASVSLFFSLPFADKQKMSHFPSDVFQLCSSLIFIALCFLFLLLTRPPLGCFVVLITRQSGHFLLYFFNARWRRAFS